jgi:glutamate formiminotransferase/formiminotetrahydrofolate cyclodeaminase
VGRLELVPNISEGRDPAVVAAIVDAFCTPGVRLLDVDGNRGAHRTVLTLVGEADALVKSAVAGARAAVARIDLTTHRGVHVRMGALDVCPFVPLDLEDMPLAVAAAREAGRQIGAFVPVYLYGEAARVSHRRLLHEVRRRGFESLAGRMAEDPPDFGAALPHPTAGATAVGARFFLVALNVDLSTADAGTAEQIARSVREWSSVRRDSAGRVVGATRGRLEGVRARGWFADDFGCAQVSTNITDYRLSPPHAVLAAVREEAKSLGVGVLGSELIGCVPLEAMRTAGIAYGADTAAPDRALVAAAVTGLGLDRRKPFDPDRKVLEWAIACADRGGPVPEPLMGGVW